MAKTMEEVIAKKEALSAEKTLASEQRKELEVLRREKLEIAKSRNEEKEWSTFTLNKLQSTYEKQRADYEAQAQIMADIIKRARKESKKHVRMLKQGLTGSSSSCHVGVPELRQASTKARRSYGRSGRNRQPSCRHSERMLRIGGRRVTSFTRWMKKI